MVVVSSRVAIGIQERQVALAALSAGSEAFVAARGQCALTTSIGVVCPQLLKSEG